MSDRTDMVNHPPHYTGHPSGVECIQVVEHMNFCLGSAMKYLWRAGKKGDAIEDLKKARWYLDREIARLEAGVSNLDSQLPEGWGRLHAAMYARHREARVSNLDSTPKEDGPHGDRDPG